MKKNILLIFAIILLIAIVAWMFRDLFYGNNESGKNPYDYGMKSIRGADTIPSYTEIAQLKPVLEEITSISNSPDGRIYVAGNGGAEIMDESGKMLKRFTINGNATCITCMPDGTIAIGVEDHVELRNPSGMLISVWQPADSNSVITSIAAKRNLIFVADAGKKIVYEYNLHGKLLAKIGEKDPQRKIPGFIIPSPYFDIGISPSGDLWVANTGRYKLEKYDEDGSLLFSWGISSMTLEGFAGCCNPTNFSFLPDGSFVTSEKGIERVKIYAPDGTFRALVAGPSAFDEGTRGLDLAAGKNGQILVLDPSRNQVRVFIPSAKK